MHYLSISSIRKDRLSSNCMVQFAGAWSPQHTSTLPTTAFGSCYDFEPCQLNVYHVPLPYADLHNDSNMCHLPIYDAAGHTAAQPTQLVQQPLVAMHQQQHMLQENQWRQQPHHHQQVRPLTQHHTAKQMQLCAASQTQLHAASLTSSSCCCRMSSTQHHHQDPPCWSPLQDACMQQSCMAQQQQQHLHLLTQNKVCWRYMEAASAAPYASSNSSSNSNSMSTLAQLLHIHT